MRETGSNVLTWMSVNRKGPARPMRLATIPPEPSSASVTTVTARDRQRYDNTEYRNDLAYGIRYGNTAPLACATRFGNTVPSPTPGYSGENCEDDDECGSGSHTCGSHSTCANVEGGFNCICNDGFEKQAGLAK